MSNKVYQLEREIAETLDDLTDGKFIGKNSGNYNPHYLTNLVDVQFVDEGRDADSVWKVYGYGDQLFRIAGYIDSWCGSIVYTSFDLVKSKVIMKFEYSVLEESDLD